MDKILPSLHEVNTQNNRINTLIEKLYHTSTIDDVDLLYILEKFSKTDLDTLSHYARLKKLEYYGDTVYMRGLIEFSNYCKQGCLYCGISHHNKKIKRYRLTQSEILDSVISGLELGFNTFVLQSGEEPYYTDNVLVEIVRNIKLLAPSCALTLSIGERSSESYRRLYDAGVDRYLLRHETASKELYQSLHPNMNYENRINCLKELKSIGYQVGAGFMVGLPKQNNHDLLNDLKFLKSLEPHMCGIGPYICHSDTPLQGNMSGTLLQTLVMVGLTRLLLPKVLLPATTALGTLDKLGREKALKFGANVVMPNLTPTIYKDKYELYQNKICLTDDAKKCRGCIETKINLTGFHVDMSRGDHYDFREDVL